MDPSILQLRPHLVNAGGGDAENQVRRDGDPVTVASNQGKTVVKPYILTAYTARRHGDA
ncbi:MAG TPA: hypothetical protein VG425_03675 [Casimicrobiaceae bacterium]|nr:hypothetical protein [Casimicrobiaceae bacterium]